MAPGRMLDEEGGSRFPETRWSAISEVRDPRAPECRRRFEELCQAYWRPIFCYFRRARGYREEDARDLTQEFFIHVLESPLLERADRRRARFRTYLKACLSNFAAKEREARRRLKRGGDALRRSLDLGGPGATDIADAGAGDPSDVVDREWRRLLVERAIETLRASLADKGREGDADIFRAYYLPGEGAGQPTYADLASRFGVKPSDLVNRLHRARKVFRASLIDQIRDSATDEEGAELEYRELFGEDR